MRRVLSVVLASLATALPGHAASQPVSPPSLEKVAAPTPPASSDSTAAEPSSRNGQQIFAEFLAGRADTGCDAQASSSRWEQHFSKAPSRLADQSEDVLPLFGYVVDELRAAGLPTEFALIPFIESGYHPDARSGTGPVGLWQLISATARNHEVSVSRQYDGRLSAVDSTTAAVRYLSTLYGMFGGDWRLAMMAYNAGEYRVLQAMRRAGMNAQNAKPEALPGLAKTSYAYVEKVHALACVLDHAQTHGKLMARLDRQVPILDEHTLPAGTSLQGWADRRALPADLVGRLNPALPTTRGSDTPRAVLAPRSNARTTVALTPTPPDPATAQTVASTTATVVDKAASAVPRGIHARRTPHLTHTVRTGESAWTIARRYGVTVKTLLTRNGLHPNSVLKPGMVLAFDDIR